MKEFLVHILRYLLGGGQDLYCKCYMGNLCNYARVEYMVNKLLLQFEIIVYNVEYPTEVGSHFVEWSGH